MTVADDIIARLFVRADWMTGAPCAGRTDLFYPQQYQNATAAKAICAECPHRVRCLEFALDNAEEHGIWGGTTRTERQHINRNRRDMGWQVGRYRTLRRTAS